MSLSLTSLAQQALLMLQVYDPGEAPSTNELNDLLLVANNMLDNWSLERINIPVIVIATHALTGGTATYTFGPASTFGTRYLRIQTVGIINSGVRTPVKLVSQEQYQAHFDKTASTITPEEFYYDYQFPVATGYLWPVPSNTATLEVGGWQALQQFADTTTAINLPQGFDRMLVQCFALEIAPQYPGVAVVSPQLIQNAAEAKAAFRSMNASNMMNPNQPPQTGSLSAVPAAPPPGGPEPQAAA